ncbi:phenylalanine--tRNA ligase subunit beta [Melioribacteraceae bacterium 4301-Me]|uniref:phenylalanine--tRNA ligase subunit beta n=1 Tax=Pyranulibacter aquaticus TaxID=3163344 RepID=UPI0035999BC0
MKVSINWLKNYVDLSGIPLQEIIDKLTLAGLEVEEVYNQSEIFKNIVVGFVKDVKKHPNADKLKLCVVSDGKSDFNVICGAPNVAVNQKVAFAKIGAVIPDSGQVLSKVKIRGEVSYGMICSEKELGLSDNHEGIMVLNSNLEVGMPLSIALGMNDIILEVAITPNRQDALSHIGIARDLAAIFDRELILPEIKINEEGESSDKLVSIEVIDSVKCPRYVGKVVTGVTIKESPEWLKTLLKNIGLRPINNVVDVTNFVLYEIGQPLHAFDLNKLAGKKIIVKTANEREKFVTLDSKERQLSKDDLMICDGEKSVAIAGIMGGENSEVTFDTKNILIESAFFNPSSIRKTSKRLGLSTEASYRFERGTDPDITLWAARRAAQLILETAGGKISKGEIDVYPNKMPNKILELRYFRLEKILGYKIDISTVNKILEKLGFEIIFRNNDKITVKVPLRRHDVEREIDLIEEVARIYGYDKIPEVSKINVTLDKKIDQSEFANKIRDILTGLGFYEIITNSLLKGEIAERFGVPIRILNPQSSEMTHLRTSLIPGTLLTISKNIKVKENDLMFFEIGKVFNQIAKEIRTFEDFEETEQLIITITGKAINTEWYEKDREFDFYDLKGFATEFFTKLFPNSNGRINFCKKDDLFNYRFEYELNGETIGYGGKLNKEFAKLFDITQNVFSFVADLDKLRKIEASSRKFKELLKFPKVYRDFAFILDRTVTFEEVVKVIKESSSNLLHNIKLFDIFQSDSLGKGKKSLAFQLEYYSENRTLTEEEVDKDFWEAIKAVEKKLNGKLRGK